MGKWVSFKRRRQKQSVSNSGCNKSFLKHQCQKNKDYLRYTSCKATATVPEGQNKTQYPPLRALVTPFTWHSGEQDGILLQILFFNSLSFESSLETKCIIFINVQQNKKLYSAGSNFSPRLTSTYPQGFKINPQKPSRGSWSCLFWWVMQRHQPGFQYVSQLSKVNFEVTELFGSTVSFCASTHCSDSHVWAGTHSQSQGRNIKLHAALCNHLMEACCRGAKWNNIKWCVTHLWKTQVN